jgi:hypothetical protein
MKQKDSKIYFKYNGVLYKLLNVFADKKDNSIYFHLYERANRKLYSAVISNKLIYIDKFEIHDFEQNKISFHESGYIHSTNEKGEKLKSILGIPFKEIQVELSILVIVPKKIESLIVANKEVNGNDLIIDFENKKLIPFILVFDVIRISKKNELLPLAKRTATIEFPNKEFGLRLHLQEILGESKWPEHSISLIRTG